MRVERGENWTMIHGMWQDSPLEVCDNIICDPPYTDHVSKKQHAGTSHASKENKGGDYREFELSFGGIDPWDLAAPFLEIARRWVLCWCAVEQIGMYELAANECGFVRYMRALAWIKSNPTPQFQGDRPAMWGETAALMHTFGGEKRRWNGGGHPGIYHGGYERKDRVHETQKPLWLMRKQVDQFTEPGELIWDPFAGSGTTGVAALLAGRGRHFVGHEMQEKYFEVACERLEAASKGLSLEAARSGQGGLL